MTDSDTTVNVLVFGILFSVVILLTVNFCKDKNKTKHKEQFYTPTLNINVPVEPVINSS